MRKWIILLSIMAVLTGTVGFTATNASGIQLTEAEKDGYWLFIFPYQDAKALVKKSSETINIKNEGKSYKYVFTNHILSCGTNMNGFIIETLENGKLIVKGLFTVSNNPYKIERLEVNLSKNLQAEDFSGIITVDNKEIDYSLFSK